MAGTLSPLRIEIIDPVTEPLEGGLCDATSAADAPSSIDDLLASVADAWGAASRHVDPVRRFARRWSGRGQRVGRALHDRSLQLRHDGNPRRNSTVRQHVFESFETVADRLGALDRVFEVRSGTSMVITSDFVALRGGGRQAEATLSFVASWPRLPVLVRVEPWWREQSIVTVELRTRRRLRYPFRYFRGAHAAARVIGLRIAAS